VCTLAYLLYSEVTERAPTQKINSRTKKTRMDPVIIFAPGVEGLEIGYSEDVSEDLRGFKRCTPHSVTLVKSFGPLICKWSGTITMQICCGPHEHCFTVLWPANASGQGYDLNCFQGRQRLHSSELVQCHLDSKILPVPSCKPLIVITGNDCSTAHWQPPATLRIPKPNTMFQAEGHSILFTP
jgi:hypothetical protein